MTTATQQPTSQEQPAKAKGKGGAPKGSCNAWRHGLRMGALPPSVPHIGRDLNEWRRYLESCVVAVRGVVGAIDEATINRAVRFERKLRLAERHLAAKGDDMTSETYLAFEREGARWLLDRDRALADLELEQKHLAGLYALANGNGEP